MFNTLKNKTKSVISRVKKQAKKIAIGLGIVGVAFAAEIVLQPDQILPDYQLKAPKEKVLGSKEVDWIDIKTKENKGKIISYDYVSDKVVGQASYANKLEDLSKRNNNTQFFKKDEKIKYGKKIETWMAKVYSGTPFLKDNDGQWKQTETATTTVDAFNKQTKPGVFENLFNKIYAATATTTYANLNGDGFVNTYHADTFSATRALASGDDVSRSLATDYLVEIDADATHQMIGRGYFPFYTAGIPDGVTISTSTLFLYFANDWYRNNVTANDGIAVVESFQTSISVAPVQADYNDAGYGDGGEDAGSAGDANIVLGSNAIDFGSFSGTVRYWDWQLNATGLGWIKTTTQTSKCGATPGWTCLAIREQHDYANINPSITGDGNAFPIRRSPYADITYDPYMTIEYTVVTVVAEPDNYNLIIFD